MKRNRILPCWQPNALQLLVLYHQFFAIPDGNLRWSFWNSTKGILHLHHSSPGRCQRTGSTDGDAASALGERDVPFGCICGPCDVGQPRCESRHLQVSSFELPQCKQLIDGPLPPLPRPFSRSKPIIFRLGTRRSRGSVNYGV